jgi:hypothetical protein
MKTEPRHLRLIIRIFLCALCLPFAASAIPLRASLAKISVRDTVCKVWVIFTDKNGSPRTATLTPRAFLRRSRAKKPVAAGTTAADIAISPAYIAALGKLGCRVNQVFKWANAASVTVQASRLTDLADLVCVRDLVGVRTFSHVIVPQRFGALMKRNDFDSSSFYGESFGQLSMMKVPVVHSYVTNVLGTTPGAGVLIGLFDTGFRTKHACFSRFIAGNHVLADSDFIDKDGTVNDPDSVANNPDHPYYQNDNHGSMTLSLIAGYDPPRFAGVAWGATFVLARTEDTKRIGNGEIEKHYEEDNWAAAMVWAESLGVDIVSSSLGYRTEFTPPDTDYTYRDMDGSTTIISKAARQAARFGVVVVNAMGNDGSAPGSINAPADADSIVSVGAIDNKLKIANFSSRGPTSDGRIKPDCVAQGVDDVVPWVYGPDSISYTLGNGTSFATPLVAGVCALILQSHPHDDAATVRSRLYSSCVFVPGQNTVNAIYGRGLPDAKIACLPAVMPAPQFVLFPNVLNFGKKHQQMNLEFIRLADTLDFTAAIRSIDGMLIWAAHITAHKTPFVLPWPSSGKTVAPGVYYFSVNYAGKTYRQKFFVTG